MFTTIHAERRKRAAIVCFLKKILQGACADVFTRPTCKRAQHCCATLRRSQNNRNVETCLAKSLTGKLYATSANKCQHCSGSMQTDETSHNIVGSNLAHTCEIRTIASQINLNNKGKDKGTLM